MVNEIQNSSFVIRDIYVTNDCSLRINDNIDVHNISVNNLKRLTNLKTPNKVLAIVEKMEERFVLEDMSNGITLILDGIKDPGNFGTIIRLCDWFNVKNIICSKDTVDLYNSKVIQATMGSISRVNVFYKDLVDIISNLPIETHIYAASMGGEDIQDIIIRKNSIIVLGNESVGISNNIKQLITNKITIKKEEGGAESLNVAIAASIILYEFNK
jgi:TrmH family RNA methyltransferase|tara:strand:- start:3535 stop:4176 length:642 start_codon:yes stop_codon:yes gene_type:complete